MKTEHPIIFNAEMVRAILAGKKTQTRRVIKPQPIFEKTGLVDAPLVPIEMLFKCPHGFEGHTLWVRETCRAEELDSGLDGVRYIADDSFIRIEDTTDAASEWLGLYSYSRGAGKTVPSIHMPRWASRIDLVVDNVRVERVQDITASDALAEGVNWDHMKHATPIVTFQELWNSINEKRGYGWATNPWVWVVKFHMIEG